VDLERKTLRVVMALQRFKGKLVFDAPKTRSSARQLPLPDVLVSVLRAHRAAQEVERLEAGESGRSTAWSFRAGRGPPPSRGISCGTSRAHCERPAYRKTPASTTCGIRARAS
jgi:hypothetical protein